MKIPKVPGKLFKYKASARSATADDYADEMPTMRLSSALIVVGLLHVIAIGGIWAFNNIKSQKIAQKESAMLKERAPGVPAKRTVPAATPAPAAVTASALPETATAAAKPTPEVKRPVALQKTASATPAPKIAKTTASPTAAASAASAVTEVKASTQTYTVMKGDNPVTIARKFKVSSEDLTALNKIEDPRKLRIGQVLKIPKAQTH